MAAGGWTRLWGLALAAACGLSAFPARAELGRFDGYEIRVIRPRYMAKRNRIELGGEGMLIMNQSFIYTFMLSGILDYHFSEMFALEFDAAYGFSIDKDDKRTLQDQFQINTQILRTCVHRCRWSGVDPDLRQDPALERLRRVFRHVWHRPGRPDRHQLHL